jgi:hypothetical protein
MIAGVGFGKLFWGFCLDERLRWIIGETIPIVKKAVGGL